jgi:hypothetical protein
MERGAPLCQISVGNHNSPRKRSFTPGASSLKHLHAVCPLLHIMVLHVCPRCNYRTSVASNFKTHLRRKNMCTCTTGSDLSREEILRAFVGRMDGRSVTCEGCGTTFTCRSAKCRHRKTCERYQDLVEAQSTGIVIHGAASEIDNGVITAPQERAVDCAMDRCGYIYIITCDALARDSLYKIGRTVSKIECIEEAKKNLVKRYATYWIDPRVIAVVPVADAIKAESYVITQSLQNKRQVSNGHLREIIQGDLEREIMPAFENAATMYAVC